MGFLGRLLGRSPEDSLEQAESLLERGEASRALGLARKVLGGSPDEALCQRAEELAARAETAMLASALERVKEAEEAELWEEALDYLEVALERTKDPADRAELEARQERLEQRLEEERAPRFEPEEALPASEGETAGELQNLYWALIDALKPQVSQRYEDRSEAFQAAYVALNEGDGKKALEGFEALAAEDEADPVLRLERGRCRLMNGQAESALEDLELAWAELGSEPLDHAGALLVPVLWSEAQLALGEPGQVSERLSELGPEALRDNAMLLGAYSQALLAAEEWDEALEVLEVATARFPSVAEFPHALGTLLVRRGQKDEAIAGLDAVVRKCCTGGSCSPKNVHPPTLRLLAGLLLEQGGRLDRVEELLALTRQAQGGGQTREDLALNESYLRQIGDERGAARIAAQLESLTEDPSVPERAAPAQGPVQGPSRDVFGMG